MLFTILAVLHTCHGLESSHPEVLLQPRNFNPHPYTDGGRVPPGFNEFHHASAAVPVALTAAGRRGPVLFPSNPGDDAQSTGVPTGAPIQDRGHPYAGVARKHKIKLAGRFSADHHVSCSSFICRIARLVKHIIIIFIVNVYGDLRHITFL